MSDFSGSDALIIKDQIRTEQYNLNHLNAPNFVSAMEDEDFVYMTFREEAVEYMNCGKVRDKLFLEAQHMFHLAAKSCICCLCQLAAPRTINYLALFTGGVLSHRASLQEGSGWTSHLQEQMDHISQNPP